MSAPTTQALAQRLVIDGAAPDSAETLARMLLDRLRYDQNGPATVLTPQGHPAFDGAGNPVSVVALVDGLRREIPQFWTTPIAPAAIPSNETLTVQVAREAREGAARKRSATANINPWLPATKNITRQVYMEARDPDRAARMKADADL